MSAVNNINIRKRAAVIIAAVMALMLLMPMSVFAEPASDGADDTRYEMQLAQG